MSYIQPILGLAIFLGLTYLLSTNRGQVSPLRIAVGVLSQLVVAFLLVPSLNAVAMVALSICSICVGVIGYMTLWDVNLDSVSMINLVLCIGFSVDFSAHICYHFSISADEQSPAKQKKRHDVSHVTENGHSNSTIDIGKDNPAYDNKFDSFGDTPRSNRYDVASRQEVQIEEQVLEAKSSGDEKATEALSQLGMPIIQGALSTILGVSVLSTSNTYIFRTFFKVIFLVMCFGFYHAMIVLPVVLSFFNDLCCGSKNTQAHVRSQQVSPTRMRSDTDVDDVIRKDNKQSETSLSKENVDGNSYDSGISANHPD